MYRARYTPVERGVVVPVTEEYRLPVIAAGDNVVKGDPDRGRVAAEPCCSSRERAGFREAARKNKSQGLTPV